MSVIRKHLPVALTVIGLLVGVSYVAAQAMTSRDQVSLVQSQGQPSGASSPAGQAGAAGPRAGMGAPLRRAIRGEVVVKGKQDGQFQTVKFDRGVLDRVDGTTIVLKEDDGTTVSIPTTGATRVRRDGQDAKLSDLKAGDHIGAIQTKDGNAYTTKFVRAISEQRFTELQQQRQQRRQQRGAANGSAPGA